mmetsp:Transcript_54514/g.95237  ORF Transcript_54514/g.95237 Transcript_54514/m.95237 type:complete len:224 (-) Transcript_54514:6604-7275(-)
MMDAAMALAENTISTVAEGGQSVQILRLGARGLHTGVDTGQPDRVDAQADVTVAVKGVVHVLTDRLTHWTVAFVGLTFQLEPEAEVGTVAGNVVAPEVGWRGRPEHRRFHVRLEQGAAASDVHTQVASNIIVSLSTVLHKIGVTRDVIGNVVAHLPVVGVMSGDGALVTVMDTVGLHIRGDHVASHVTVGAVTAEVERLSAATDLCVLHAVNATHKRNRVHTE